MQGGRTHPHRDLDFPPKSCYDLAMQKEKIGLFGGSFNPVHIGHLIMAQDAEVAFGLNRIFFIPAMIPPHKLSHTLVTPAQRIDMLRLALGERSTWEVSDVEIQRGGISYTIDTVRHFAALYREAELFFIIGGDTLPELPTWREINALLDLCSFVTMVRPGFEPDTLGRMMLSFGEAHRRGLRERVTTGHTIGVSSTEIRMKVAQKQPIHFLVPEAVAHYIRDHGLYQKEG